jgi:exosortase
MTSVSATARGGEAAGTDLVARLLASATALAAVALCLPTLGTLHYLWRDADYYGHGYALPLTAGYLAYCRRREIRRALRRLDPPRFGAIVALGACAFEVLTYIGDVGSLAGLGIPLVLGAAAYAIGGTGLLRPLLLPLLFLVLMIPPPQFVVYELLFRLKLFVTQVAVAALQAMGTTVAAEGNQILLPGQTLFVADACSGLTSIVTMLPLACIVAYFLSHGVWRRAVVIASIVPLAIGANILRVVITVRLVTHLGADAAQGLLHDSFGMATYAVGILALIGVARVLR